jgi:hypothetical protein
MSFLRSTKDIAGVVLTDHAAEYTNKYVHEFRTLHRIALADTTPYDMLEQILS